MEVAALSAVIVTPQESRTQGVPQAPIAPPVAAGRQKYLLILEKTRVGARRAVFTLSHTMQRLGHAGVVGIALLAFSLVFVASASFPLHRELGVARDQLAEASREPAAARSAKAPASPELDFVRKLPARGELPAITRQIVDEAGKAGLALNHGSYRSTVTHSGGILRARMSFPVTGTYPSVRSFVHGTLAAVPSAAVDGLKLERKSIGEGAIEAEVSFAVFLRNDP